jgi:hypothetical protein
MTNEQHERAAKARTFASRYAEIRKADDLREKGWICVPPDDEITAKLRERGVLVDAPSATGAK